MHPDGILLEGANGPTTVAFSEISSVRIARSREERLAAQPTIVLERGDAGPIRIASLDRAGVVLELAEQLAAASTG